MSGDFPRSSYLVFRSHDLFFTAIRIGQIQERYRVESRVSNRKKVSFTLICCSSFKNGKKYSKIQKLIIRQQVRLQVRLQLSALHTFFVPNSYQTSPSDHDDGFSRILKGSQSTCCTQVLHCCAQAFVRVRCRSSTDRLNSCQSCCCCAGEPADSWIEDN